ncbi:MAG: hypothetical protein Q7S97_04975 [Polaromonas sp.]|nr:hypothetical protein [Polaromonas sp.]
MLALLVMFILFYRHLYRQKPTAFAGAGDALGLRGGYSSTSIVNYRREPASGRSDPRSTHSPTVITSIKLQAHTWIGKYSGISQSALNKSVSQAADCMMAISGFRNLVQTTEKSKPSQAQRSRSFLSSSQAIADSSRPFRTCVRGVWAPKNSFIVECQKLV